MIQVSEAVVYSVPLVFDDDTLLQLHEQLSPVEQARAARFLVPAPKRQFVGCRVALRYLLSQILDCDPLDISLEVDALGKPFLKAGMIGAPVYFNVSHSRDLGLVAIAHSPIGVDLEMLDPRVNVRSLVNQVLSDNEAIQWAILPARQHADQILRLWVCKEALLKAMGLGIAEGLKQVSFPLPVPPTEQFQPLKIDPALQLHLVEDGTCSRTSWTDSQSWIMHPLEVGRYNCATLATTRQIQTVDLRSFDWNQLSSL